MPSLLASPSFPWRLGPTVVAVAFLAGCGAPDAGLDGSLTAVCDLEYTKATLLSSGTALTLKFVRPRGTGEDTLLQVSVTLADLTLEPNPTYDLAEGLTSTRQRGTFTRDVFGDTNTKLPLLERGQLKLKGDPAAAKALRGELSATFLQGHEFGAGRTVFGTFRAEVNP